MTIIGFVVLLAAVGLGPCLGWNLTLGVAGPILDLVGAMLTLGAFWSQADYFPVARQVERGDKTFRQWWLREFPLAVVTACWPESESSRDFRKEFKSAFWGVVFLSIGFVFQALSQITSRWGA